MASLLVIDDDQTMREIICQILTENGYEVTAASGGREGIKKLEENAYDLVLTDLEMPEVKGMEVLSHVVATSPDTKCIILTGYGSIKSSVDAMKEGAFDYITKPVTANELTIIVQKALTVRSLEQENVRLKRELRQKYRYNNIIGTSDAIKKIYRMIEKVADTDTTVLITGPSGTGKELVARAIHYDSERSEKPLIVINCGAIPEELLESELFGHEKGAFTGAHKLRIGRFERANGGTIFLDEVGEMSPTLQVKLLRVLQEQKFERVGGTKTIHVDVRVIAATNKNLTVAINNGKFREDLFYRLNVIPIKVPSLKQRKTDIPLLVEHFLKKLRKGKNDDPLRFSSDAMDGLFDYDWPGNIRELENVVKRLTVLCENPTVGFEDLPDYIQKNSKVIQPSEENVFTEGLSLDEAVRDFEKKLIHEALEKSNWVKTKAAKLLNIKRTTLVEKIKKSKIKQAGAV